jgi:hypothetical protein
MFVFLSLTYFAFHDDFQFHPVSCKQPNFILLHGWITLPLYVEYFLYLSISWWTPRLIP